MDDLKDDISELSLISSYSSSPGNTSQDLPELEDTCDIPGVDIESDASQILSSRSISLVATGTPQPKRKQLTLRELDPFRKSSFRIIISLSDVHCFLYSVNYSFLYISSIFPGIGGS